MFKSFRSEKSAELLHQPGLEYWFKERRTLIDFRRGPLGPYVDGFAAYLNAKGYSYNWGRIERRDYASAHDAPGILPVAIIWGLA